MVSYCYRFTHLQQIQEYGWEITRGTCSNYMCSGRGFTMNWGLCLSTSEVRATASLILEPKYASAVSFIFNRIMEEISSGWNFFSCTEGKMESMNCELVAWSCVCLISCVWGNVTLVDLWNTICKRPCLETNWTKYQIEILRYYEICMPKFIYLEIVGHPASPWALTMIIGLSPWPATHLKGHSLISACTMGSANLRPIKRLASKTSKSLKVWQNCEKKTPQQTWGPLRILQWGRAPIL